MIRALPPYVSCYTPQNAEEEPETRSSEDDRSHLNRLPSQTNKLYTGADLRASSPRRGGILPRMTVEDVILRHDKRGVTALRPHLPSDFCRQAARLLADHAGVVMITTGFYILRTGTPETDGPPGAVVIGHEAQAAGPITSFEHPPRQPAHDLEALGVDVLEHELVHVEDPVTIGHALDELGGIGASSTHDDDLHAASRIPILPPHLDRRALGPPPLLITLSAYNVITNGAPERKPQSSGESEP